MKQSDVDLLKSLLIKKSKMKSENGALEINNTADGLKARIISIESNKLYRDSIEGVKPSLEEKSEIEGSTGDIELKLNNANHLDESKLMEKTTLGITTKRENGNITFDGTGTSSNAYLINSLEVELEKGDYFFNWFGKHKNPYFTLRSQSGDFVQNLVGSSSNNNEINVEEKTVYQIGLHGVGTAKYTPEDTCFTLMISKKNDEKYTEYQSQTHTISLDSKIMYGNENTRDGIVLKNGKWNWKNLVSYRRVDWS